MEISIDLNVIYDKVPESLECDVCDGKGKFSIINAYDLFFEKEELCWACNGYGIKLNKESP